MSLAIVVVILSRKTTRGEMCHTTFGGAHWTDSSEWCLLG